MKAWRVSPKDAYCAAIVFAETRGQARSTADLCNECLEELDKIIKAYCKKGGEG